MSGPRTAYQDSPARIRTALYTSGKSNVRQGSVSLGSPTRGRASRCISQNMMDVRALYARHNSPVYVYTYITIDGILL